MRRKRHQASTSLRDLMPVVYIQTISFWENSVNPLIILIQTDILVTENLNRAAPAGNINEAELRHLASSLNFCCRNWEVAFVTTNTSKKWSLIHSFVSRQKTKMPEIQSSLCRCEFTNWCFCLYIKHHETIWSLQINHRKTNILSFSRWKLLICHSSTPSTASNITVNQAGHLCCRLWVKKKTHFWNIKRNPEVSAPAVTSCHQQWLTDQGSQRAVGDGWGELDNDEVLVLSELLDLHTLLRHHVQLLQGVGLLRVPNRSDHIWSKTGNKIGQCLIKLPLNNN